MNLTRLLSTAEMAINRNMGCIEIRGIRVKKGVTDED